MGLKLIVLTGFNLYVGLTGTGGRGITTVGGGLGRLVVGIVNGGGAGGPGGGAGGPARLGLLIPFIAPSTS